jgi:hypothetical protein
MDDSRQTLKKAGTILIAIGAADIVPMRGRMAAMPC